MIIPSPIIGCPVCLLCLTRALILKGNGLQHVQEHIQRSFSAVHDSLAAESFGAKRDTPGVTIVPTRSLEEKAAPILRDVERRFTQVAKPRPRIYLIAAPLRSAETFHAQVWESEGLN